MQPAPLDLPLYRGDDFALSLIVYSGAFNPTSGVWEKGLPLDLTGWTGSAQIRSTEDSTTVMATFTVEFVDAPNGAVLVAMPSTVTAELGPSGVWDLQFTDGNGNVLTYLKGKVNVTKDVTRVGA